MKIKFTGTLERVSASAYLEKGLYNKHNITKDKKKKKGLPKPAALAFSYTAI